MRDAGTQPVCPACIFRRLSTGATTTSESEPAAPGQSWNLGSGDESDADFLHEYELLGEVGRGGMGVIYKAYQARLNRTVALKVIHAAGLAGENVRRRFQSEVKMAGRLNHPNIVPVFDVGMIDGCPSFSMEYFPGGTLSDWIRRPERPIDEGVRLLVKVARAISFAHLRGVLHRDLKPGNILMDASGEPHVADFGLAKELNSSGNLTHSGAVLGSPNYMSPEQASGRSEAVTVATDVYSLGATLYEMLAGRPPFVAATPLETMRLVVEQEAPRPSTISGRADRDLEIICLKCLDKDPSRRYATAADLSADLERWLRHEPILARPTSQSERFYKWIRRHPALAGVSALLLLVLVAGLAGVIWQWRKAEEARRNETLQLRRAESALARSSLALAESALREGNSSQVQAALEAVPPPLRDATWAYLQGEADTSRVLPEIGVQKLGDLAAHPTLPSVFAAADRRRDRIVVFNVRSGRRLLEFAPGFATNGSNGSLCVAISGDRIAVGRGAVPGGLVVHDVNDGRKLLEWAAPRSSRLEYSPDGSRLLQVGANRKSLTVWDARAGAKLWSQTDAYHSARFASDGIHLAAYSWTSQLRLVRVDDGTSVQGLTGNYFQEMAMHPGGDLIVAANPLGFVRGFDPKDGRQRFEFQPHQSLIRYVAFLPGGERFLTAATLPDDHIALQCWDSGSGRSCQTLTGGSGDIVGICLHPVSGELIVNARDRRVWETASVPPLRVIRGGNAHPSAVFWGSRDLLFAPGRNQTSADLQSIAGESPSVVWRAESNDHGQPSVSADGRRAAIGRYNSTHRIAILERTNSAVRAVASVRPRRATDFVRISPAGDRVAVVENNFTLLELFDVAPVTQSVVLAMQDIKRVSDLAWLDGGRRLAGLVTTHAPRSAPGSVEQLALWDVTTGRQIRRVTNESVLSVVCASPDGRRLVEAGVDRNLRLRDGATLQVIREFRVHNAPVTALAWHPTRPIVATASEDLVIRLWNLDDGTRLEELRGPLSPPSVLSFSPDGTRLATAARDGVARIWEPRSLAEPELQK